MGVPESCRRKIAEAKEKNLKSLDLSNLGVQDNAALPAVIPPEVFELVQLEALDLRNNRLSSIPSEIVRLSNLVSLNFTENHLTSLPDTIGELALLRSLNLSANWLTSVPDCIQALSSLIELDLFANRICRLPEWIGNLTALTWLCLGNNELTNIPTSIGRLGNLVTLNLNLNRLSELPGSMSGLNIRTLLLRNNHFNSIPDCIYSMSSLEYLDFSNDTQLMGDIFNIFVSSYKESPSRLCEDINSIRKSLPPFSFPKMEIALRSSDFEGFAFDPAQNVIRTISPRILELINLDVLCLDTDGIESPPPEVAQKGIRAVREYFRQIESQGTDFLYEAKFLIVGEAGAGKTSLARKIENPEYQLREDEGSTQGIDVIRWYFDREDGTKFQVNIWDFGGQEIYHATHQFFLTKRSLYALVADDRKEDTDFYYWLNIVELLSDNSPVVIVKNEKLDRHRDINERQLRGQFTNLKETMSTNLATNRRLVEIIDAVKYHVQQLPHVGTPLPKTWVRVREALEKDARDYISVDEYFDICERNGFAGLMSKRQLSGYLHDLGVCLHFQEDPLLDKIVILKPKWGTDAVYKALDDETVVANRGRFTRVDLSKIWSDPKYTNMQNELLQLMINFKLCYRIPDSEEVYIAPQLLTANQPSYDWDEAENLILRYDYQFMPKGILTRFIVSMHPFISAQELVWKSGVILEKDQTKAEVVEHYEKREIRIRVRGKYL